jgi:hypothetical protein
VWITAVRSGASYVGRTSSSRRSATNAATKGNGVAEPFDFLTCCVPKRSLVVLSLHPLDARQQMELSCCDVLEMFSLCVCFQVQVFIGLSTLLALNHSWTMLSGQRRQHQRRNKQSKEALREVTEAQLLDNEQFVESQLANHGESAHLLDELDHEEFAININELPGHNMEDEVGGDTSITDGYKTPPRRTPRLQNPPGAPSGRPRGAIGDVLVGAVELISISGVVIANINTDKDDWSTHRVRLIAAEMMKVAPKFVNLADESGRLVLDNSPITTKYLTVIVMSELSK